MQVLPPLSHMRAPSFESTITDFPILLKSSFQTAERVGTLPPSSISSATCSTKRFAGLPLLGSSPST